MTFLLNEQLLVAGDALAEVRRFLIGSIERCYHHRVDTTKGSTHGLRLRTEKVHITVEHRHIVGRCRSVDSHLRTVLILRLILLHNLSPEQTGGTELGNLHEVVLADTHVEFHLTGSQVNVDTSVDELLQVLITPSQSIAQFLYDVGTGVVKCFRVYGHHMGLRIGLQQFNNLRTVCQTRCHILTLSKHVLNGVETNGERKFLLIEAFLREVGINSLCQ